MKEVLTTIVLSSGSMYYVYDTYHCTAGSAILLLQHNSGILHRVKVEGHLSVRKEEYLSYHTKWSWVGEFHSIPLQYLQRRM